MDDDSVAGGADRALNGMLIIVFLIIVAIIIIFILGGAMNIYYWFNPSANPVYKRAEIEKAREAERQIQKRERQIKQEKKQAVLNEEVARKKTAVDLGLSVLWSDTNIFAISSHDAGAKFAWGEINKRTVFRYADGKLNEKWEWELKKIIGSDDLSICGNKDFDAASSLWGESWRLPLKYEIEELINNCEWQWSNEDGVKGYKITGKTGNSIFLPISGEIVANDKSTGETGYYWSGIATKEWNEAYCLYFDNHSVLIKNNGQRWHGMAIRPVWSEKIETTIVDGFTLSAYGTKLIKSNDSEDCHIPYGVKVICREAFKDSKNVKRLYIPQSVEEIEDFAFSSLNIEFVHIPASIVKWGEGVFNTCINLKEILLEDGLSRLGRDMFLGCGSLDNVVLPQSLFSIPDNPFYMCSSLKHIELSSNLTNIGEAAFYLCKNLKSIVLPNSLIGLRDCTFQSCYSLVDIILGDNITVISSCCFEGCYSLKKVRIPSTIQHIDEYAFAGCDDIILEVPYSLVAKYQEMELEGVGKVVGYDVELPQNSEVLKSKSDSFIKMQQFVRDEKSYELRKEIGLLTKEEYEMENDIYFDIID